MKLAVTFAFCALLGFNYCLIVSSASCGPLDVNLEADAKNAKILTSPNFPANYPASTTCSWLIASRYNGLRVQIKLISFDTYSPSSSCTNSTDNLEVYDGRMNDKKLLARYCGGSVGNVTVTGTKSYIYLKFSSPSNKPRKGFKLEYMAAQDSYCGPFHLNAEAGKSKILTSPNYSANYPPMARCSWLITAPPGQYVKLNFTSFELDGPYNQFESCNIGNHTLKVFDSNQTYSIDLFLLGKYCGKTVPADLISSKRYLSLIFERGFGKDNSTQKGFRLEYTALPSPANYYSMCSSLYSGLDPGTRTIGLKATSTYQYIQSPLYPDKYPSNMYCSWHITTSSPSSSSKRIKLEVIDVKIKNKVVFPCSSYQWRKIDALKISGGDNKVEYCDLHNDSSTTVTSSGQDMTVSFHSNTDNYFTGASAGFKVRYMEVESYATTTKTSLAVFVGIVLAQFLLQLF